MFRWPCHIARTRSMGSRFRGDDILGLNLRARNAPALFGLGGLQLRAAAAVDPLVGMIHGLQAELPRAQIGLEVGGRERLGIQVALRLFALLVEEERGLCRR